MRGLGYLAVFAALSVTAYAGELQISDVNVDQNGYSYSTSCRSYSGYYNEFGSTKDQFAIGAQMVSGDYEKTAIGNALTDIAPAGWRVDVSPRANELPVSWSGREPWTKVLRKFSSSNNALVIVDWESKRIIVDKL